MWGRYCYYLNIIVIFRRVLDATACPRVIPTAEYTATWSVQINLAISGKLYRVGTSVYGDGWMLVSSSSGISLAEV